MKEQADNKRTFILSEAIRIAGHRGLTHGSAALNMRHTADLWSAYIGVPISGPDVAVMMTLLKLSRIKCGDATHIDSYVDAAGYTAIAGEINGARGL